MLIVTSSPTKLLSISNCMTFPLHLWYPLHTNCTYYTSLALPDRLWWVADTKGKKQFGHTVYETTIMLLIAFIHPYAFCHKFCWQKNGPYSPYLCCCCLCLLLLFVLTASAVTADVVHDPRVVKIYKYCEILQDSLNQKAKYLNVVALAK